MMGVEETARMLFEEQAERYGYEALAWDPPALNRRTFIDRAERLLSVRNLRTTNDAPR